MLIIQNSWSVCCIYTTLTVSTVLRHQRNYAWVWEQRVWSIPRWYQLHYSRYTAQCIHLSVLYHCRNTRVTASNQRQVICLILLELKTAIVGLEAGVVLVVVYCVMCVLCTQPSSSRAHYNWLLSDYPASNQCCHLWWGMSAQKVASS